MFCNYAPLKVTLLTTKPRHRQCTYKGLFICRYLGLKVLPLELFNQIGFRVVNLLRVLYVKDLQMKRSYEVLEKMGALTVAFVKHLLRSWEESWWKTIEFRSSHNNVPRIRLILQWKIGQKLQFSSQIWHWRRRWASEIRGLYRRSSFQVWKWRDFPKVLLFWQVVWFLGKLKCTWIWQWWHIFHVWRYNARKLSFWGNHPNFHPQRKGLFAFNF